MSFIVIIGSFFYHKDEGQIKSAQMANFYVSNPKQMAIKWHQFSFNLHLLG